MLRYSVVQVLWVLVVTVCLADIANAAAFLREHGHQFSGQDEDSPNGLYSPLVLSEAGELPTKVAYSGARGARQDNENDDENEKDDEGTATSDSATTSATTRLGFQNAQERVRDYGSGVLGIVSSAATLNLRGILHGSTQFIPPHIRVGVEDILGSIIGSPLNPNRFLVTYPTAPSNLTTEIIDFFDNYFQNRTVTPLPPNQVDPNRIPIAETEATTPTTPKVDIIPKGSQSQSSSSPTQSPQPTELTPANTTFVESNAEPAAPEFATTEIDHNDIDDESEEDDDSRSLFGIRSRNIKLI